MDHDSAVRNRAVERYVLEELSPEERDGFEEHYFSCAVCADEVRTTTIFVEHAKAVLERDRDTWASSAQPLRPTPAAKTSWLTWLRPQVVMPVFAVLLFGVIGLQQARISELKTLHAGPAVILQELTRGEVPTVAGNQPVQFEIPLQSPAKVPVKISSDSGVVETVPTAATGPDQSLLVSIPAGRLKPGRYSFVVNDTQYPFQVR